mmetsp:Transcript_9293/g.27230  ORF Transcript_9293/g.27230 Transcript_9293/m.27230 type:complete len:238 (-) Transcript_9293:2183-2896(-)
MAKSKTRFMYASANCRLLIRCAISVKTTSTSTNTLPVSHQFMILLLTFLTHRLVRVHGVLWSVWRLHFFPNPLPLYQVVTRRSVVFPQLKMVHFRCLSCDVNLGPFRQNNTTEVRPDLCPCCQRHGPFKVNQEQTVYGNYQKLAIQETPGSVPPGRVPRHKDVVLLADLIDVARPGEEVDVTGVYVHSSISLHYLFPAIHRVCLRYDAGISGMPCSLSHSDTETTQVGQDSQSSQQP